MLVSKFAEKNDFELYFDKTASKWLLKQRHSKQQTFAKHKMSLFFFLFSSKMEFREYFVYFIHSVTNSKSKELSQSLGRL